MQLTKINGEFELLLPEHRSARKEWDLANGGWEVLRIDAMLKAIHKKANGIYVGRKVPVVFDIGTEEGDISAILQKYSPCEMVLFEPNHRVWPCIKAIWEANKLEEPLDFFSGFLGNAGMPGDLTSWNNITGEMIPDHGFKQLYENYPDVPVARLDDWCAATRIFPDIITMDVEGAEFEVIRGAEAVIVTHRPTIFMSVHPVFMYESYRNEGKWKEMYGERQDVVHMLRFIDELGYTHRCIEYDYHELHMVFEPK